MKKGKRLSATEANLEMKERFTEDRKDSSVSYTPVYIQSTMPAVLIDRDEY